MFTVPFVCTRTLRLYLSLHRSPPFLLYIQTQSKAHSLQNIIALQRLLSDTERSVHAYRFVGIYKVIIDDKNERILQALSLSVRPPTVLFVLYIYQSELQWLISGSWFQSLTISSSQVGS